MEFFNGTSENASLSDISTIRISYAVFDSLIAIATILGNLLIVVAFWKEQTLQSVTNYFVFSLAIADLFVGAIGMPLYIYSMLTDMPTHFETCILIISWILMFCTISILHLIALSFDRYTVIVLMWRITQTQKEKRAKALIGVAWAVGASIGLFPLMGWNMGPPPEPRCVFVEIMDFSYLVFLFYATIIAPTLFMVFFYAAIFRTVRNHETTGSHNKNGNKKRMRQYAKQRKIIFSLVLVVLAFFICWYPLYTINAVEYYCADCQIEPWLVYVSIVLSHLSSAINPLIYAYTMPGFKDAFKRVILCQPQLDRKLSMMVVIPRIVTEGSTSFGGTRTSSSNLNGVYESSNLLRTSESSTGNLRRNSAENAEERRVSFSNSLC